MQSGKRRADQKTHHVTSYLSDERRGAGPSLRSHHSDQLLDDQQSLRGELIETVFYTGHHRGQQNLQEGQAAHLPILSDGRLGGDNAAFEHFCLHQGEFPHMMLDVCVSERALAGVSRSNYTTLLSFDLIPATSRCHVFTHIYSSTI